MVVILQNCHSRNQRDLSILTQKVRWLAVALDNFAQYQIFDFLLKCKLRWVREYLHTHGTSQRQLNTVPGTSIMVKSYSSCFKKMIHWGMRSARVPLFNTYIYTNIRNQSKTAKDHYYGWKLRPSLSFTGTSCRPMVNWELFIFICSLFSIVEYFNFSWPPPPLMAEPLKSVVPSWWLACWFVATNW